jgi:hypothetical protein
MMFGHHIGVLAVLAVGAHREFSLARDMSLLTASFGFYRGSRSVHKRVSARV